MSRIDKQSEQQKTVHLHYHYHYYNPTDDRDSREGRERMSKSQYLPPKNRYQQKGEANVQQQRNQSQLINRSRQRSFKKLRISNCWSQQNSDSKVQSKQKQVQLKSISSFTVKEEQISVNQDDEYSGIKGETTLNYSIGTRTSEEYELQRMLIRYKQELQYYKRQVDRLRRVEEQCIYLRKNCLAHYESCE